MRKFLYITPWFPPTLMVGALRPLKFLRSLEALGWRAVVLCGGPRGHATAPQFLDEVPSSTIVIRNYTRSSDQPETRSTHAIQVSACEAEQPAPGLARARETGAGSLDKWELWNAPPDLIPFGWDLLELSHASTAALEAQAEHPDCEAIVVSCDPQSGLIVGRRVHEVTGLPLILDFRDPWSICELRRPKRWLPQRWIVDYLERSAVSSAAKVILNTETALIDYRRHYNDIEPERFCCIRNSTDKDLISTGPPVHFDRFTLLFLGRLRPYVEGEVLIQLLANLRRRGFGSKQIQLVVTSHLPKKIHQMAIDRGVIDSIVEYGPILHSSAGAFMNAADVLVSVSNATQQRIPAKTFDYICSERPVMMVTDNCELRALVSGIEGCNSFGWQEVERMSEHIEALFSKGRHQCCIRANLGFDSKAAGDKLFEILNQVAANR
ncbi:MAG: glycosyltransferase family 4 protein [Alphaproteobacteria bacterium]|nr:glycosyltransferase family 4 protein [Alphaproteobacteria bacterium]